jgi:hypothetical protein
VALDSFWSLFSQKHLVTLLLDFVFVLFWLQEAEAASASAHKNAKNIFPKTLKTNTQKPFWFLWSSRNQCIKIQHWLP